MCSIKILIKLSLPGLIGICTVGFTVGGVVETIAILGVGVITTNDSVEY